MKNTVINISQKTILLFLMVFMVGLVSCEDFLSVTPKDQVTDAVLWDTENNADKFLMDIYGSVPDRDIGEPLENYSDNAVNGIANSSSSRTWYARSLYTPSDGAPDQWGMYSNIRKTNLFIEKVGESELSDSFKTEKLAEARFLRAYFYHLLWTWHGGVPIITEVLNRQSQGDDIYVARSSSEETVQFIRDELTAIADDLSLTANDGRATKGAALTLRGWVELYAASPLHNPSGDVSKWELAAETYQEVMDLEIYDLFPDYNTLHFEENNNNVETIFAKQHSGGTYPNYILTSGPTFVNGSAQSYAYTNPTQEVVDAFFMENGLPIDHPESGYDPQNPYENREQRFYQSIVYDGSMWDGHLMLMREGVGSRNETDLSDNTEATNTGYYWRKGMDPQYHELQNHENGANGILFRYAEVLLGYAEAQNEVSGPDASVYDAIDLVRSRSDLPPLDRSLNQEQMREAIIQERRVELVFEGKRWYDLLRLKLAEEKLNTHLQAMQIEEVDNDLVYTPVPAPNNGERVFYADKNYLLPIPQSAMDRNPELTQNPGYEGS